MTRIALIHALAHSVAPINEALARTWPEATRMNLLDDSLSADLASSGSGLDAAMHARFLSLAHYAVDTGAEGILFTCSAFGPCLDAVALAYPCIPVLKPNAAMIAEVSQLGCRVGLIASFAATLISMPAEFPVGTDLRCALAADAMLALDAGDTTAHDQHVVHAARTLAAGGCTVIALAQFSMARAAPSVRAALGLPVFTTPDSAVKELRRRVGS